jgi:hypothetical protein
MAGTVSFNEIECSWVVSINELNSAKETELAKASLPFSCRTERSGKRNVPPQASTMLNIGTQCTLAMRNSGLGPLIRKEVIEGLTPFRF